MNDCFHMKDIPVHMIILRPSQVVQLRPMSFRVANASASTSKKLVTHGRGECSRDPTEELKTSWHFKTFISFSSAKVYKSRRCQNRSDVIWLYDVWRRRRWRRRGWWWWWWWWWWWFDFWFSEDRCFMMFYPLPLVPTSEHGLRRWPKFSMVPVESGPFVEKGHMTWPASTARGAKGVIFTLDTQRFMATVCCMSSV